MKHIYKDDHCVPTLGELTDRISTRMIELADDIDMSVAMAVCAIAFVKKLLRSLLFNDLLFWQQVYYSLEFFFGKAHWIRVFICCRDHDGSLDNLYKFLIDDPASVRTALGKLVYDRLISQEFNSSQSSLKGRFSLESYLLYGHYACCYQQN